MSDPNAPQPGYGEQPAPDFGASAPAPSTPSFDAQPPAAPGQPSFGAPEQPSFDAPQASFSAPQADPFAQQAPQYGAPAAGQPQYGAPQDPNAGQYQGGQPYGAPGQPYGAPGQQQYGAPQGAPMTPQEEKTAAMWGHLGGIFNWVGPLIVFLIYKDRSPFVKQESKEALNFQLTSLIGFIVVAIVLGILGGVLAFIFPPLALLATGLIYLVPIYWIVFAIIGAVRVNNGGSYRYPLTIRMIK